MIWVILHFSSSLQKSHNVTSSVLKSANLSRVSSPNFPLLRNISTFLLQHITSAHDKTPTIHSTLGTMAYSVYNRPTRSARLTILWLLVTSVILMILYTLIRTRNERVKTFATKLVSGDTVEKGSD
jgi:hypothetical protein